MTEWKPFAPGLGESAAEQAARDAQHQVLIDLLGAYADRELPPETTSRLEAHLVGCVRCRRELAMHHALRRRLGVEPPVAAPPALRERIAAVVATTPIPALVAPALDRADESRLHRALAIAVGVTALALFAVGGTYAVRSRVSTPAIAELAVDASAVPLLRDVLDDYDRVTAGDLPGRSRDLDAVRGAVPFPIAPLRAADVRLVGAWTTELGGDPAAVLAYRWEDRIVFQYFVSEERFFQNPALRRAVVNGGVVVASGSGQRIVAWPTRSGGALLIGDVPLARLESFVRSEPLARTMERGAQ